MKIQKLTEQYNKGEWVEVNLNTKKNGTPNIIPVKVDKELYHGKSFLGWAWGERQYEYPMSAIVNRIDGDDTTEIIKRYSLKEDINVDTVGDYITDHYDFDDIDDKYSCINSIRDSFKDEKTISKEELEQFIGSHNGKDKVNESTLIKESVEYEVYMDSGLSDEDEVFDSLVKAKDFAKQLAKKYGPQDNRAPAIIKRNNGEELPDNWEIVYKVYYNESSDTFQLSQLGSQLSRTLSRTRNKRYENNGTATHCVYFTQDGIDQIEFEGSEDECNQYISSIQAEQDDEFGDEAPERFIKRLDEASYGGAFDIADDEYFTREDIENAAEEVLNHINETFTEQYELGGTWFEDGRWIVNVKSIDGEWEFEELLPIDMRKIKEPWHLKREYSFDMASKFIDKIKLETQPITESLNEDTDTVAVEGPKEGPEAGLSSLINEAIQDELKTIDIYNSLAITARNEGYEDIAKMIDEINTEENKHVGQLQEALKSISPNAIAIEDGTAEGQEQLSNAVMFDDDLNDDELGIALFKLR